MLSLVVLFADLTLPDAAVLGIYSAEDGEDVGPDEALSPTSSPPLRAPDAETLLNLRQVIALGSEGAPAGARRARVGDPCREESVCLSSSSFLLRQIA
jgi:hypothetical protein